MKIGYIQKYDLSKNPHLTERFKFVEDTFTRRISSHSDRVIRRIKMTKEKLVQSIKDCGQSLIDNAEKIASYKYLSDISICCYPAEDGCAPRINIDTDIIPEGFVDERCNS